VIPIVDVCVTRQNENLETTWPMPWIKPLLLIICALSLPGCAGIKVTDYAGNTPALVAEDFFNGRLTAHGVVKDRSGKVIRYFNADISASWRDGIGTLDEDFVFNDGEHQRRVWTLTPTGPGRYDATAGDVVGTGKVRVAGNSMFLDYVLRIPWHDDSLDLHIDDRMYLVSPTTIINESRMIKFGLEVGQILLVIERRPGDA
jgi:hypothetical protein